jgi:hypothetical protein
MSNVLLRITNFGMEIAAIIVFAALNGLGKMYLRL